MTPQKALEETWRWREELHQATAHMTTAERLRYWREVADALERKMGVTLPKGRPLKAR